MSDYPAERAADVVLSDGAVAHLRPIRPDDADAVVALHSRFSERTRYLRYFSPYPQIPPRDLRRFVEVDHHDREALVVESGRQLVAVCRYDRIGPEEAEVALVVEDAYQGRGVGSVLLEHLAATAGAEGISRFIAEVLPENARMQRVFSDAGYHLERSYRDGVMHFSLDLTEAARAVEVAQERERLSEARSIARLLSPRSVAVVGASSRAGTIGDALMTALLAAGFTGTVHPVNPRVKTVRGLPAHRTVSAIGQPARSTCREASRGSAPSAKAGSPGREASRGSPPSVDLAVIATPAIAVPGVVRDCAAAGVSTVVMVSAGFAETGPRGAVLQDQVVRLAHRHGMRVVGPNCFGVANLDPAVRLNATLAPELPQRGRVGFFCQSGAFGIALLALAAERGLGLSSFVSAGNRADVSGNDLLQYWYGDPATDVVLLYLETFGNPRKFARVARQLARRKPVVAVANRGSIGARDEAAELFEQHGVIQVATVAELFDVGLLLAYQPLPAGDRVAVVGNSTALGLLAVEACRACGLRVPDRYPVDVGSQAGTDAFAAALREAVAADDVDAIVAVFVPPLATPNPGYARELLAQTSGGDKPVVATFVVPGESTAALRRLGPDGEIERGTVPAYPSVEEAVRALGRVAGYARWRREPAGTVRELTDVDTDRAGAIVQEHLEGATPVTDAGPAGRDGTEGTTPGAVLADAEAADLLGCYGIEVVASRVADSAPEAMLAAEALGYPVTLKLDAFALRGRVDLGAVRLDLSDAADVERTYAELEQRFGAGTRVRVQPMRPPGVACRVRVAQDPAFGPIVGFGLGGTVAELVTGDLWRAAPLTDVDAAALVRGSVGAPLLLGHRDTEPVDAVPVDAVPVDTARLLDLLLRVGCFVAERPQVRSLELKPVLVSATDLSVLHATVTLGPYVARPDSGPRRLT